MTFKIKPTDKTVYPLPHFLPQKHMLDQYGDFVYLAVKGMAYLCNFIFSYNIQITASHQHALSVLTQVFSSASILALTTMIIVLISFE